MARNPKHSKKSRKRTAGEAKEKLRKETGIDDAMAHFFLNAESKITGQMFYKPPRWKGEYEKMKVSDLLRRIQGDLNELCARAYPTATPHYRLVKHRLLAEEPRHAADALAFITKRMATYLENLFVKRSALMMKVAAKYDLWPVNLGIRDKNVRGVTRRELQRVEFAREYLIELGLNSKPRFPGGHESGAEHKISPFKLAAEDLYTKMLLLKSDHHIWFPKVTPWAKRLFALTVPMTKRDCAALFCAFAHRSSGHASTGRRLSQPKHC